jgi:hypothetical protein
MLTAQAATEVTTQLRQALPAVKRVRAFIVSILEQAPSQIRVPIDAATRFEVGIEPGINAGSLLILTLKRHGGKVLSGHNVALALEWEKIPLEIQKD